MKAVGFDKSLNINNLESLFDFETENPKLVNAHDLLVEVKGISVNPVDYKIRRSLKQSLSEPRILGWDASGLVTVVGTSVQNFKVGDEVFYAGEITRPGINGEFHLVDERIVGKKPKILDFENAAALPLTSLTAYESLFDRLEIQKSTSSENILIIGAAGGVGSIAIQLIKALTPHRVIATASRAESKAWVKNIGADYVIDHTQDLITQPGDLGIDDCKYIFGLNYTEKYLTQISEIIQPQGKFCLIDDPDYLDVSPFKKKSVSIHWELMFTRSLFKTGDMERQQVILNEIAALIDEKKIRVTTNISLGVMNAENLRAAHAILESGRSTGKITLRV